ncbi:MAG: hypothetical protein KAI24_08475, partial [Planctomycetes bacterium]|nr:hypothetical protein [Planctomycetota bacterium]
MSTTFPRPLVAGALLAVAVGGCGADLLAQRLLAYDPVGSTVAELQPPDPVLFTANPPVAGYPTAPILPPPIVGLVTPGDSTFDNLGGLHWFTDGFVLAAMPTAAFPSVVPVPPPLPFPPPVLGAIGGPVTGMAIDPAAGVLFVTSAPGLIVGVVPAAGMPVVVPPFPLPFAAGPISGLEWDGATGTLWACSIGGVAFPVVPGGGPAGAPVAPPFALPGPAGDVAIDKMGKLNPAGLRPLYVTAGGLVFDIQDPAPLPFPAGPINEGLSFVNHPLQVGPMGGCASCPTLPGGPTNFTTGPMTSGNAAWGVGMSGLSPGTFCVFGFDTVYNPLFPTVNVVGCPTGLSVTPTLLLFLLPVGPAGTATFPISLAGVPVGATLYNQGFAFCSADPTGFVFSPFRAITV